MPSHRLIASVLVALVGAVTTTTYAAPADRSTSPRETIERLRDLATSQGDQARLDELARLERELASLEQALASTPARTVRSRPATRRSAGPTAPPARSASRSAVTSDRATASGGLPALEVVDSRREAALYTVTVGPGRMMKVTMLGRRAPVKPRPAPGVLVGSLGNGASAVPVAGEDSDRSNESPREAHRQRRR